MGIPCRSAKGSHDDHDNFNGKLLAPLAYQHHNNTPQAFINLTTVDCFELRRTLHQQEHKFFWPVTSTWNLYQDFSTPDTHQHHRPPCQWQCMPIDQAHHAALVSNGEWSLFTTLDTIMWQQGCQWLVHAPQTCCSSWMTMTEPAMADDHANGHPTPSHTSTYPKPTLSQLHYPQCNLTPLRFY